jgi:dTMP kinase
MREPGGTPVAERVRALLLDPAQTVEPVSELFLFLAARAELVARVIRPALSAGRVVIADRFQLSTEAYQCGGRGLDLELFRAANRAATGGLQPDLTLVLDLPTELGFDRIRTGGQHLDRIEQAGSDFHARVAAVFRNAAGAGLTHLNAAAAPDEVARSAWSAVQSIRGGAEGAPPR